ncbi:MAG: hypothetical protein V1754_07770 [Pseudomonadota bacterium]
MRSAFLALVLVVAACGGEELLEQTPESPAAPPWENIAPTLHVASPDALSVGQNVTILGQDFIAKDKGSQILAISGTYFDDQGESHLVDLQVTPKRENSTRLSWKLWPNIVFSPTGDRLGYLLGQIRVINVGKDGTQKASLPLPIKIQVKPSLLPRTTRPLSGGCQSVVNATLEDVGFYFRVEAIGLRDGQKDAPLNFTWSFNAEHWEANLNYGSFDPESVMPKTGSFVFEDKVTSGRESTIADGGNKYFLLKIGSDLIGETGLKELRTKQVPQGQGAEFKNSYFATVNVAATDASGKSAVLVIPIEVFRAAYLSYDGNTKIAERYPPEDMTGCIPGGDIGRQVTYREDKAQTRSRSLSFNFNANAALTIGLPTNPFALALNTSAGFGVDVNATATSTESQSLDLSSQLLPGEYGTVYRQTTKIFRVGQLVGHNKCGQEVDLGEAILTDWVWAFDFAQGPECSPQTNLPPAERFYSGGYPQ